MRFLRSTTDKDKKNLIGRGKKSKCVSWNPELVEVRQFNNEELPTCSNNLEEETEMTSPRRSTRIRTPKRFYDDPTTPGDKKDMVSRIDNKTMKIPKSRDKKPTPQKPKIICGDCGHLFFRVRDLTDHQNGVHLQLKLFGCQIDGCDKSFSVNSSLRRHIRIIHEKLKPFVCQTCNAEFSTQDQLNGHTNRIHLKIRHQCTQCEKSYPDKSNLRRHFNKKH